ncbi:MAG: transposase, partial [Geminicoccaceae bacterium]|nr:transposase [Geminicoccaceae bacterium]
MRPPGLADRRFASLYLFAARRPGTDRAFARALPEATTASMSLFLAHFAQELEPSVHAVLVLDQAGWHVARGLSVPKTFTLPPLPAYSPEPNPVEQLGVSLPKLYLSGGAKVS